MYFFYCLVIFANNNAFSVQRRLGSLTDGLATHRRFLAEPFTLFSHLCFFSINSIITFILILFLLLGHCEVDQQ